MRITNKDLTSRSEERTQPMLKSLLVAYELWRAVEQGATFFRETTGGSFSRGTRPACEAEVGIHANGKLNPAFPSNLSYAHSHFPGSPGVIQKRWIGCAGCLSFVVLRGI
jgi:hypothetical protein